jgi:DNA-binding NarL/FixJ family response regulator
VGRQSETTKIVSTKRVDVSFSRASVFHTLDPGSLRMKVLIVDDNPAIRGAVRNLFETDPTFQVCGEAENGREAIQKTAELRPELIIMDLSMPVLNGLDAARGIRRIKQAIPIILFSGYSDLFTKEEARSVGIAALVPKSEPSILLNAAHEVLGQSAA